MNATVTPQAVVIVNETRQAGPTGGETLLEWLREQVRCTDVRQGCDTGHCGVCAVLVDGRPVKACSMLACELEGLPVITRSALELTRTRAVEALTAAIGKAQPFQCGYCESAFMMAAVDLLEREPGATEASVRHAFSGLLCRCTGYQSIVDAVLVAASSLSPMPRGERDAVR